jgi:hypothetical protein
MPTEKAINFAPRVSMVHKDGSLSWDWRRWLDRLVPLIPKIETYSVTLDPASIAANTTAEQTFTVSGLKTNDIITINKPSNTTGVGIVNARVSATDTLAITFINATAGAVNPASETYKIISTRL